MTEKEFRQNLIIGIPNVPPIDNIKIQAKPVVDNKIETNNEVERALEELKHLLEMIGESWSATTQQFKASWFDTLKSNAQNLVAALEAEKNLKSKQRIAELEQIIKSYKIASFIVPDKWIKELEELQKNMPKPEPEIFVDEGKVGEDFTAKAKVSKDENEKLTIHEIVIEEPKIDMKEECVEPVSIWKDVSEEIDNQSIIFVNKAGYARLAEYWNDKVYFIEGDSGDVKEHCIDKNYYGKKYCTLTDFINSFEQMQKDIEELKRK